MNNEKCFDCIDEVIVNANAGHPEYIVSLKGKPLCSDRYGQVQCEGKFLSWGNGYLCSYQEGIRDWLKRTREMREANAGKKIMNYINKRGSSSTDV